MSERLWLVIGDHVGSSVPGFPGEPRVNRPARNLALDRRQAPGANSGQ